MSKCRMLLLDQIRTEFHQTLFEDPEVLKLTAGASSGVRHGMAIEDIEVNGTTIFQTSLNNQVINPVPEDQVRSIQVRESHPNYGWILLNTLFADTTVWDT